MGLVRTPRILITIVRAALDRFPTRRFSNAENLTQSQNSDGFWTDLPDRVRACDYDPAITFTAKWHDKLSYERPSYVARSCLV